MIASYKRPAGLMKAIQSLHATAHGLGNFEVLVRLSIDDHDTDPMALWQAYDNVFVYYGRQLKGYNSLCDYFTELLPHVRGKWVSILDDDMTLEGNDWDVKLAEMPARCMVLCDHYRINQCDYPRGCDGNGVGWFVPNKAWEEFGENRIGQPPDKWMRELLVTHGGWPIKHLPQITLNHAWGGVAAHNR